MAAKPVPDAPDRPPSLLDTIVGYQLRRVSSAMMSDSASSLAALGLRPVLFAMLCVIRSTPGIIQMRLGTELGIQRANLVPLVNELTARDLIERRPAPNDRRALALHLTATGERLLDEAKLLVRDHEERMLALLGPAERSQLLGLLAKIRID
jgi:DNA-binding MarR family transcriptional regulator